MHRRLEPEPKDIPVKPSPYKIAGENVLDVLPSKHNTALDFLFFGRAANDFSFEYLRLSRLNFEKINGLALSIFQINI